MSLLLFLYRKVTIVKDSSVRYNKIGFSCKTKFEQYIYVCLPKISLPKTCRFVTK